MKRRKILMKGFAIAALLVLINSDGYAQQILEKSGKKPHFTNWSRGKDFKYLTRKSQNLGLKKGAKYLFIGEARERAYWSEGLKEYGSKALEVVQDAEDDARVAVAFLLNTAVANAVDKSLTMSGLERQNAKERSQSVSTKANFGGFLKVGSYYQKELDADKNTWFHSWALFSYEKEKLEDIIEQYADAVGIPDLKKDIMSEIETAAEDIDGVDDEEFNFN